MSVMDIKTKVLELKDALKREGVPLRVKVAIVFLIAYLLCPIDLIPDFIPVLGQLDDILVAGLVVGYVTRELRKVA
jgi:uncharacterized membrane protein YkvA (DUF1232 family)